MPEKSIETKINEFLNTHNLFGKKFVVGFSGGFDSMCLLDVLSKADVRLVAAHFNHCWRVEADDEENACKSFCACRGIEFYSERASKDLKKTETDARNARYEFFERVKEKFQADGIFTAHNLDDNAETLIYRIIKGTGIVGLQGIAQKREDIYRPILGCTRGEIEEYCKINKLTPNVDSSNYDIKYKRNLIRHEILPKMAEVSPDVKFAVNKLSEIAKQETAIIEEYLALIAKNVIDGERVKTKEFIGLSEPVRQRLLYSFLTSRLPEYDMKRVCEILDFILLNAKSSCAVKTSLTTSLWLSVNKDAITVYEDKTVESLEIIINGVGEYGFGASKLVIEECSLVPKEFPSDKSGIAYVDLSLVEFPLILRYGKATDKISPVGMNGNMLFKKFLSGKRVPQHLRSNVAVLGDNEKLLWVPKLAMNNCIKVDNIVTHKLTWKENA